MVSPNCTSKSSTVLVVLLLVIFCALIATASVADTPKTLSWSVEPPASPWNLGTSRWTEFVVTTAENSPDKKPTLALSHSTIIDSDSGRGVQLSKDHFHLCADKVDNIKGCAPPSVGLGKRTTVWLAVDEDFAFQGTFTGNLFLDAPPLTETKTLALTIQQSTPTAKTGGVLTILAGVVAAWFITVFARARIARDQALLPIAVLREKLAALQEALRSLPEPLRDSVGTISQRLVRLLGELEPSSLDNQQLLPPRMPGWTQSTTQAAAYQAFLQARAQTADSLDVLVSGIQTAAGRITPTLPAEKLAALKRIAQTIDQMAGTLPQSSDALRIQIKALFDSWNAQGIRAEGVDNFAESLAIADAPVRSAYSIRMEIQTVTMMFWLVWGTLSVLTGAAALVLFSPGFGTVADYFRCLFWGFGLPVAGNGLQQLTMSQLNTQLGVTIPK